jgi:transposase
MLATALRMDGLGHLGKSLANRGRRVGAGQPVGHGRTLRRCHLHTRRKRGANIGKTKVGKGVKIEIITDRTGVPIGVVTAAASQSEGQLIQPALATIPEGVDLVVPTPVIADKAYDDDSLREELRADGFILISPHRQNRTKKPTNDGRRMRRYKRRWIIERTIAWMHSFRRITTRHERYSFIFDGFVHLGCALLAISRF